MGVRHHSLLFLATFFQLLLAVPVTAAAPPGSDRPVLGTAEQQAAESLLLQLLADPEIKAAMAKANAELARNPIAQTADGKARLAHAVEQYTASLILSEYAGDVHHPRFILSTENTPRHWFGRDVPGSAMANDNPDQINRLAFIDGDGTYEVSGRVDADRRVAQLSFSLLKGWRAGITPPQQTGKVFLGNQYATRMLEDLTIAADGSFSFTLGPNSNPHDPTHIRLEPGPYIVQAREVLADWHRQIPPELSIRRTDQVTVPRLSDEDIRRSVLAHLHDWVTYWGTYSHRFLGGLAPNAVGGPFAREGGIGYLALARFHLKPGQGAVMTITGGGAAYFGMLGMDPWMITFDGRRTLASLSRSQSVANPDGSFTYVASPTDPGVANWIDTSGLHDGFLSARWLGVPNGRGPDGLLREFSIITLADLSRGALPEVPRATAAARQAQLKDRGIDYGRRFGK